MGKADFVYDWRFSYRYACCAEKSILLNFMFRVQRSHYYERFRFRGDESGNSF